MFFAIPIRTDRRLQRLPWVNYGLVGLNVLVGVMVLAEGGQVGAGAVQYMLSPTQPRLYQYITYQFLHNDWMHLGFNMVFLFAFGNSVEDRLGKLGYLAFYLGGGVIAGLGHALMETAPVLGASGAVAAVCGAYLVLFPLSEVTMFYWMLVLVGTFEITSMLLMLFQIAQDAVMYLSQFGGVAYLAHLSGYAYGFVIGMVLLWGRLLPREPYDMLALIERHRRRAQFRSLTRQGYQPWQQTPTGHPPPAEANPDTLDPKQQQVLELRNRINRLIQQHHLAEAVTFYTELLGVDPNQVLGQQYQLDLANQMMHENRYESAAHAYELFLKTYPGYAQKEQIALILGLIYGRYVNQHERAKELLTSALPRLQNPTQKDLATQVLKEIST